MWQSVGVEWEFYKLSVQQPQKQYITHSLQKFQPNCNYFKNLCFSMMYFL